MSSYNDDDYEDDDSDEPIAQKFGKVSLVNNMGGDFSLQLVSFAKSNDDNAMLISAIGASTSVKSFSAVLLDKTVKVGVSVRADGFSSYGGRYAKSEHGYEAYKWRIDGNWWHLLAMSKDPKFIPYHDDNALWERFTSNKFTTPIIREWMPFILDKLRFGSERVSGRLRPLQECSCFNCQSAMLNADDEYLDKIVSDGIKTNQIKIPSKAV